MNKPITSHNIDQAIAHVRGLKNSADRQNMLDILTTLKGNGNGFIVQMSADNYKKYVELVQGE